MNFITIMGSAAAELTTASFVPQAIKTIRTKNTGSISLSMYSHFASGTLLWLLFDIFSNSMPVTIANKVTLVFAIIILFHKLKFK